jgi:hypothetical protein
MIAGGTAIAIAAVLAVPGAAGATTAKKIPVISAHIRKGVSLNHTHLRAGRVTFRVHSKGEHTLQIARLHKGYTLQQANSDINAGFEGNAAAIRRADSHVTFYGGATGRTGKPGRFTVFLRAGKYLAVNFDTGASKAFTVAGSVVSRKHVKATSKIEMLTYGFDMKPVIGRRGELRLTNVSDQPHFLVLQRVKQSTTHKQVAKAFKSESNGEPKFFLKGGTDTGVLSSFYNQTFQYNLPAGKYVAACFWPDSKTGMEHAEMGMFKLVQLR